jgi:hypothetical protein
VRRCHLDVDWLDVDVFGIDGCADCVAENQHKLPSGIVRASAEYAVIPGCGDVDQVLDELDVSLLESVVL